MAKIMRWKGGYGGDMIMYLMYLSGYKLENVIFLDRISTAGRVLVDFGHVNGELTEIQKIALDYQYRNTIDDAKLADEISALDDVWIKCHYYTNLFNNITTDIVVDPSSLPFVMTANIYKTNTMKTEMFHPLAHHIQDPDVKIKLAYYNVGLDSIDTAISSSHQIYVSDIIAGWDVLNHRLKAIDLHIDLDAKKFYNHWLENNCQHFPSRQYINMAAAQDYDWTRRDLTLVERYALLILSREKFKILHDTKE